MINWYPDVNGPAQLMVLKTDFHPRIPVTLKFKPCFYTCTQFTVEMIMKPTPKARSKGLWQLGAGFGHGYHMALPSLVQVIVRPCKSPLLLL